MKQKLLQLGREAMKLIKNPLLNDSATIARLGPIPAKLQQMQMQIDEIEQEATRIENLLKTLNQNDRKTTTAENSNPQTLTQQSGRQEQKKIRIEIDGSFFGNSRKTEVFCEHKASDTLAKFLARLSAIKGVEILEKLRGFKVNRRMLVSKNPNTDYRYWSGSSEKIYSHQPIGNSGYFVLTHSKTGEKVEFIRTLCRRILNLSDQMFKVEEVGKNDWLKDLLN
ncbi:MAG: hypothetical protein ABSC01_00110 [Verrucomicrobiota bacterium]|jgi:hypothetical protein